MTDETNPYAIIAENSFCRTVRRNPDLVRRILDDPRMHDHRDGFQSCIQCGICTSGCPAARFTDYSPREIARRALDGDETLLTDDSLWACYYCYTCQSRCPRHNSVAVINQVIRGLQVESGRAHHHVRPFAEWCAAFYDRGMGGDPHLHFPAIGDAWGERWVEYMAHLLEIREELGLGELYPPETAVAEVQAIMEATGFKERLRAVREGVEATGEQHPEA
ncbi:MAG: 4Fe-4S dicluster domain-containing protein [Thermoleophilia bacterium]